MNTLLHLIQTRKSDRTAFDPKRPVPQADIMKILEAGRWTPTAHNMQNFEIIVIDDSRVLEELGNIRSKVTEVFLRENYEQLSFSEEELMEKKVGILGTMFPPSWIDPAKFTETARKSPAMPLSQAIDGSPVLLMVIYDTWRRAPESEGDALGLVSLGCLMENMWLMAHSLGISVRILTDFSDKPVDDEVKRVLGVPEGMNVVYALRLGYPKTPPPQSLRVRREVKDLAHHNSYGNKDLGQS